MYYARESIDELKVEQSISRSLHAQEDRSSTVPSDFIILAFDAALLGTAYYSHCPTLFHPNVSLMLLFSFHVQIVPTHILPYKSALLTLALLFLRLSTPSYHKRPNINPNRASGLVDSSESLLSSSPRQH